ncbi:hypothetical protein ScPMuIL_016395 [Solemya velum]
MLILRGTWFFLGGRVVLFPCPSLFCRVQAFQKCRSFKRLGYRIRMMNQRRAFQMIIALSISLLVESLPYDPCMTCNLSDVPDYIFPFRSKVCGHCGELYGHVYEHCCNCHTDMYFQCIKALR